MDALGILVLFAVGVIAGRKWPMIKDFVQNTIKETKGKKGKK